MNVRRLRLPWTLWGVGVLLLVCTLMLVGLNGSFREDPAFLPIAMVMVLGYCTVGALVASRTSANPTGWLMLAVGVGFILSGLSDEYVRYALETEPGSLPFATAAAWLANWSFLLIGAPILLLLLLFPTGSVPSPRWRHLPVTIVALFSLTAIAAILNPGRLDAGHNVRLENPTGVPELGAAIDVVFPLLGIAILLASLATAVALVLRFRRARGDERQQLRWFAYAAALGGLLLVGTIGSGILLGLEGEESHPVNEVIFFAFFGVLGIGFPAAIGVSMLKYRLYDLDLVIKKTVVFAILAALITGVGLVVAVGAGGLIVGQGSDQTLLVLLTGVAIGLLVLPLYRIATKLADRVVFGGRATPYEVLTEFSGRMGETYSTEDVLPRMAGVLGAGAGAERVRIWLRVGGELRSAVSWPGESGSTAKPMRGDALPAFDEEHAFEVRQQGDLLGAISVAMPPNDPMNPSKERMVRDLASQAGLVLKNVRLIEELRASRQRLVAAQDEERRKLERNIHDGAQQQLVALSVKLRLAESTVARDPAKARELLTQLQEETNATLEDLRDLARGIYPPLLADKGLTAALESQARKAPVPITVEPDGTGRYPQEVESAVYFCCLEALANMAKYANATRADIRLVQGDQELQFAVVDDGDGFDPAASDHGTGLQGMADRLEAIGGTIQVRSGPGRGTTIEGTIPATPLAPADRPS
jgi:signal transduction histidine kinase